MINSKSIPEMLGMIDSVNAPRATQLFNEELPRLKLAFGSSHNHQAWPGGYLDHVQEVMNIAINLYTALECMRSPMPFALSDALLVLFLHDLEKPWKGSIATWTKESRRALRSDLIARAGIVLTAVQENAMRYVEGEGDDYTPTKRVMNELAAFCHMCDVCSARIWHDRP